MNKEKLSFSLVMLAVLSIGFVSAGSGSFYIGNKSDPSATYFFVNGSSGRIGIGTTTPSNLLDVRGLANFSGGILINNLTNIATWESNVSRNWTLNAFTNWNATWDESYIINQVNTTVNLGTIYNQTAGIIANLSINQLNWTYSAIANLSAGQYQTSVNSTISALNTTANIQRLINGTNANFSNVDFNNGWTNGGASVIGGNLYAKGLYVYNITGINLNTLNLNGSFLPSFGWDNTFSLGNASLRWKDLYLGGDARINGTIYYENTGIPITALNETGLINAVNVTTNIITLLTNANATLYNLSTTNLFLNGVNVSLWQSNVSRNWTLNAFTNWNTTWDESYIINQVNQTVNIGTIYNQTAGIIANLSINQLNWTYSAIANTSFNQNILTYNASMLASSPWNESGTNVFLNNPTNNIGIGTSSPITKLDINGGTIAYGADTTHKDFVEVAEYQTSTTAGPVNMTIHTNISFTSGHSMPYIKIDGYAYGEADVIGLGIVFYTYTTVPADNNFSSYGASSWGGYLPDAITLYNDTNNKVSINIQDSSGLYYARFKVSARKTMSETDAEFSGWWVDNSGVNITVADVYDQKNVTIKTVAQQMGVGVDNSAYLLEVAKSSAALNVSGNLYVNSTNVGVGTANPVAPLHLRTDVDAELGSGGSLIIGDVAGTNVIYDSNEILARNNGAASNLYLQGSSTTGNTIINPDGGSVGIGTGSGTPAYKVEINNVSKALNVSGMLYANSSGVGVGVASTKYRFEVNAVNNAMNVSGNLYVNGSNVGIGNSNPSGFVDFDNLIVGAKSGNNGITINAVATTGKSSIAFGDTNSDYAGMIYYDHSTDRTYFTTNGDGYVDNDGNEIAMDSVGRLGIGINAPAYKLEIGNNATAMNVSGMLYANSSNVGIGTASPKTQLDIQGSGTNAVPLYLRAGTILSTLGQSVALTFTQNAGTIPVGAVTSVAEDSTHISLTLSSYNSTSALTERMRITGDGNVGIGTASPSDKLQVLGSVSFFNGSLSVETQQTNPTLENGREWKVKYIGNQGADYYKSVVLLHKFYNGTVLSNNYAVGKLFVSRGSAAEGNRKDVADINTGSAYSNNYGSIISESSGSLSFRLVNVSYNGERYIAVDLPYSAARLSSVSFEGYIHSTATEELLLVDYLNDNTDTEINSEVNQSITTFTPNMQRYVDYPLSTFKGNLTTDGLIHIGTTSLSSNYLLEVANSATALNVSGMLYVNSTQSSFMGGNVGIGTTIPNRLFTLNSTTGNWLSGWYGTAETFSLTDDTATINFTTTDVGTDRGFSFGTYTGEKLRITKDGNVGIGTTAPAYKLEIANSATALNVSGLMYVNSTNVGIGTTSPTDKLEINSANQQLRLTDSDDGSFSQFSYSSGYLGIRINSTVATPVLTLTNTSNVGIGTATPSNTLDVRGLANFSGGILINNLTNIATWESNVSRNWTLNAFNNWNTTWDESYIINQVNQTVNIGVLYNQTAGIVANLSINQLNWTYSQIANTSITQLNWTYSAIANLSAGQYQTSVNSTISALNTTASIQRLINSTNANFSSIVMGATLINSTNFGINTTTAKYKFEINAANNAMNVSSNLYVNSTNVGIGTSSPTSELQISYTATAGVGGILVGGSEGTFIDTPYNYFNPAFIDNFESDVTGWGVNTNTFSRTENGTAYFESTGVDPFITSPSISINGSVNRIIGIKYRAWNSSTVSTDGTIYYSTAYHGADGNYAKGFTLIPDGYWHTAIIDMTTGTTTNFNGWRNSTITAFRIDIGSTTNSDWEIDWIAVGQSGPGMTRTDGNLYVDGNVGIGTTTPSNLLDVRGLANFSGGILINNLTNIATWESNVSRNWTLNAFNNWNATWDESYIINQVNQTVNIGTIYNQTAGIIANLSINQLNWTYSAIANTSITQLNWTYSAIANLSAGQYQSVTNNTIASVNKTVNIGVLYNQTAGIIANLSINQLNWTYSAIANTSITQLNWTYSAIANLSAGQYQTSVNSTISALNTTASIQRLINSTNANFSSIVMGATLINSTNFGINTTTAKYKFEINAANNAMNVSDNLFVNNSNVGIGTSTPVYQLEIENKTNSLNVSGFLYANGTNVGIGTSLAAVPLEVAGEIRGAIFKDRDSIGYYVDPASTTVLNSAYARNWYVYNTGVPTSNLGTPTLPEMALFQEEFDNKLAFYSTSMLRFETYDGVNWNDATANYTTNDLKKFVGGDGTASSIAIPNGALGYRIIVNNSGSYVYLNALYMYWSSQGHTTQVNVSVKNDSTDSYWVPIASSTTSISAWPGHMYLPFTTVPWSTASTAGHYKQIRFEFTPTWNVGLPTNTIPLYKMQLWGGYPAGKRTIYSVNEDRNVTFPSSVYLSSGALGVGTTTPSNTLDVRGLANFSGGILINNLTNIATWESNVSRNWTLNAFNNWNATWDESYIINQVNTTVNLGTIYNQTAGIIANLSINQLNWTYSAIANTSITQLNWTYSAIANLSAGQYQTSVNSTISALNTTASIQRLINSTNANFSSVIMGGSLINSTNFGVNTTTATYLFQVNAANKAMNVSSNLYVNSTNVGIGTSVPVYKLELASAAAALNVSGGVYANNSGAVIGGYLTNVGNYKLEIPNNAKSMNVSGMLYANSTNVGVGIITPTAQLELADIYAAGGENLKIGDDTFFTDVDLANTLGLYSHTDSTIGSLKLGSGGGTISGYGGNIGIGTATPSLALNVNASNNASYIAKFEEQGDGNRARLVVHNRATAGSRSSVIVLGSATTNTTWEFGTDANMNGGNNFYFYNGTNFNFFIDNNGNVGIGSGITTPSAKLHVEGNATVTGYIEVGQTLTDLAEYIPSEENVSAGDVVIISNNTKVKKSYKPYDKAVVGVVSTAPAAVFGKGAGDVKLAISGRVPVKVTNEGGAIEIGDLLTTSSTPGKAMKCAKAGKCSGSIIGKAMTSFNKKEGEVLMIIMLN